MKRFSFTKLPPAVRHWLIGMAVVFVIFLALLVASQVIPLPSRY